jgi:hypothetical protein
MRSAPLSWRRIVGPLTASVRLVLAAWVSSPTLSLIALTLTIEGTLAFQATFWAVPASFLIGRVKEATDSYTIALLVLGGFLTCSTLLTLILGNPARRGKGRLVAQGAGRG